MEITSINIKIVKGEMPVRAYCSIVFDDALVLRKIRIIEKGDVFLVSMPSMKGKDGSYSDVCHPTNQQMRKKIDGAVLRQFDAILRSELVEVPKPEAK